MFELQK